MHLQISQQSFNHHKQLWQVCNWANIIWKKKQTRIIADFSQLCSRFGSFSSFILVGSIFQRHGPQREPKFETKI